jgi:hypothetical protein
MPRSDFVFLGLDPDPHSLWRWDDEVCARRTRTLPSTLPLSPCGKGKKREAPKGDSLVTTNPHPPHKGEGSRFTLFVVSCEPILPLTCRAKSHARRYAQERP